VEIPINGLIPQLFAQGKSYRLALVDKAVKEDSPKETTLSGGITGRQPD
jgi:hypothetical protein